MQMTFAIAQSKAYNFYHMCIYVFTCSMRMHAVCVCVYLHWIVSLCVLCVHLLVRASVCVFVCVFLCFSVNLNALESQ